MKLYSRLLKRLFTEKSGIKGRVTWRLFDEFGNLKEERQVNNLVVTAGKNWLADFLAHKGVTPAMMDYLAIGTGVGDPAAGNTTLGTENCTRVQVTTPTNTNNMFSLVGTFTAGNGTGAVTEAGIFNASSAGTLFARQKFDVINKGANDSLQCTWEITFS